MEGGRERGSVCVYVCVIINQLLSVKTTESCIYIGPVDKRVIFSRNLTVAVSQYQILK